MKGILRDALTSSIYHNKIFDVPILERVLGITIHGDRHDTMMMHHALYPKVRHDLQAVGAQYLAVEPWKLAFNLEQGWGEEEGEEEFQELLWYNAQDAIVTEKIFHIMKREAIEMGVERVIDQDRRSMDFAIDMFRTGVKIDLTLADRLEKEYSEDLATRLQELQMIVKDAVGDPEKLGLKSFIGPTGKEMKRGFGYNPRSPKQLNSFLFDHLGLTPSKLTQKTMQPSTAKDALWEMRSQHKYFE